MLGEIRSTSALQEGFEGIWPKTVGLGVDSKVLIRCIGVSEAPCPLLGVNSGVNTDVSVDSFRLDES